MQEGPSSPTPLSGEGDELMMELRSFLSTISTSFSAASNRKLPPKSRLTRSAIYLLRNLPSSRDAILEFYSSIFENSVGQHFFVQERDEEEIPDEFHRILSSFLETDSESWAPLISQWSLNLLGELSSKFSNRISSKHDINEVLRTWMDCYGARILIELTAQCLTKLMSNDTESTVSALLETSVMHGPNFDWVVAYIAGCFPETIITRVLSVGLKNFYQYSTQQIEKDGVVTLSQLPEVGSVVGILDHLTGSHQSVIQAAIQSIVEEGFENVKFNKANSLGIATIPYLLHLASMSPTILSAFTTDLYKLLESKETIDKLTKLVPKWNKIYFTSSGSLLDLVIHSLVGAQNGGAEIVKLIIEVGGQSSYSSSANNGCKILADSLLNELLILIHQSPNNRQSVSNKDEIPLLTSVADRIGLFLSKKLILASNSFIQSTTASLLQLTSLQVGQGVAIQTIKFCLMNAECDDEIGMTLRFIEDIELWHPHVVSVAVGQCLKSRKNKVSYLPLLDNLIRIIEYERRSDREIKIPSQFGTIISEHHHTLLAKLTQKNLIPRILKLFHLVPLTCPSNTKTQMSISLLHRAVQGLVHTLFILFADDCRDHDQKRKRLDLILNCEDILSKLSSHPIGLPMVLRFMMEGVLCSPYSVYFGGKYSPELNKTRKKTSVKLMEENMKFGSMPTHPVGATTVYHAGVIGNGVKSTQDVEIVSSEIASENRLIFVNVLFKICQLESKEKSKESSKQLALLLVDLVSPDVMYNGLPWPEEDFTKITIERDLQIRKTFHNHPILWSILLGLAESRPALCYCSVLLRALMAVNMAHWQSSVAKVATDNPQQLEETVKVLELMSIGQFLPPPLDSVGDIIHILQPFHIHCILIDIWNFMRDNIPTPVSFVVSKSGIMTREFESYKNYKSYYERLRLIMLKHLVHVSKDFKKFFVDPKMKPINDEKSMEY